MNSEEKWYQRIPVVSWLLHLLVGEEADDEKVLVGVSPYPDYMLDPDAVVSLAVSPIIRATQAMY